MDWLNVFGGVVTLWAVVLTGYFLTQLVRDIARFYHQRHLARVDAQRVWHVDLT